MTSPLAFVATSFLVAVTTTPVLRWISHRFDLLDRPNERSSHTHPTPRNGGLAIIAGIVVVLLLFGGWHDARQLVVLGWAATIAGMGLLDDLRSLPARYKLGVQALAAAAAILAADVTLRVVELPLLGDLRLPHVVGLFVTLFWIVGMTNAYNFMDGVNGIAAVQAIVCGSAYAWFSNMQGDSAGVVLALGLVGGAAGFLVFNASGSIFMGDVGSSTLGFLFAVLALRLTYWDVPFLAAVLPLLPFLVDTAITLARRTIRRERLFEAHRTHYYQRLTNFGWSHIAVSALYGAFAAVCSLVAVRWKEYTRPELVVAVVVLAGMITSFVAWVEWRDRPRARDSSR